MTTLVEVLPAARRAEVHERALGVLARTGLRVESARARELLGAAGARVDEGDLRVRLPRTLVEAALAAAPRTFTLGGRRPGWELPLDGTGCSLLADGEALQVLDAASGIRRPATGKDWEQSTDLLDALEEVGVYWRMVSADGGDPAPGASVRSWAGAFTRFSRHVQDSAADTVEAAWLTEILDVVFGGRDEVRRRNPFSFLLCPLTPLVLEGPYTDAWLATADWGLPVAAMPMPMMGLTAPVGLLATTVLGTAEALATLCLVQATAPGTPFIFAPALSVMDPHSGRFAGGAVEHALLGAATTEMARFYGLPAQASSGGTDAHLPGAQAGSERAMGWLLPVLAWPDLLVGPGLLGGSTVLSLEQLLLDIEVFRRCVRLRRGIDAALEEAVEDAVDAAGPGGDFLARPATRRATHGGEWHDDRLGVRDAGDRWERRAGPTSSTRPDAPWPRRWRPIGRCPWTKATAARELATLVARAAAAGTPRRRDGERCATRRASWARADREQVHEASLRILAEAGVRFHGERALPLLADAGARVDAEAGIARLPRAVVEAALATAPREFVLGARNPVHDYALPSPVTRYAIDGRPPSRSTSRPANGATAPAATRSWRCGSSSRPTWGDGLGSGDRLRRAGRHTCPPRVRGDGAGLLQAWPA